MKKYLRVASVAWVIVLQCTFGAGSEWISRPQPKFPAEARKKAAEGSIRFRLIFAEDGRVKQAVIAKSSGENLLDEAARQAVLRWRLNPTAIRPADLTTGRLETIVFKLEAPVGALYRDGRMAAAGKPAEFAKRWIYAPFPEYPDGARRFRREGTVVVKFRIGDLGNPEDLQVIKSSGSTVLDDAAVAAVRRWKARKEYAGTTDLVPVTFELRQR